MDEITKKIIDEEIIPLINHGELTLFLGAGFSIGTPAINHTIPSTSQLIERLLISSGISDIKTINEISLPKAFSYAEKKIPEFKKFVTDNFTANNVNVWQVNVLRMWWRAIFTTNIDNILEISREITKKDQKKQPDYNFFNYLDIEPVTKTPISPSVVKLHGCVNKYEDGFVFDGLSYALNTIRQSDWIRVCASHISQGYCLFVGSKFEESDIEAHIQSRQIWENIKSLPNWIVIREFNEVEKEIYLSKGIYPIKASAQEFFDYIYSKLNYISPEKFIKQKAPYLSQNSAKDESLAWFTQNFDSVRVSLDIAKSQKGVFTRFFSGDSPEWFYIYNKVPAILSNCSKLIDLINNFLATNSSIQLISIFGPVGSGKTTLAKQVLSHFSEVHANVYIHSGLHGLQIEPIWDVIKNSKGLFLIYIDSASSSYYAINEILERADSVKTNARLCIITESRTIQHHRNERHFKDISHNKITNFPVKNLSRDDIRILLSKSQELGHTFEKISNQTIEQSVETIHTTEQGYKGDLLATLYDMSQSRSFIQLLNDEYAEIKNPKALSLFEKISLTTSNSLPIPIEILAESEGISLNSCISIIESELAGKVSIKIAKNGDYIASARHSSISNHHITTCIPKENSKKNIISLAKSLSTKFRISDIKDHPISYKIYRCIISHHYLTEVVFHKKDYSKIHEIFSTCQSYYAKDGIFWLQYGRFLETDDDLDNALQCFKTGIGLYDSFQIRHALGQILLRMFRKNNFVDQTMFKEGLSYLETEIEERPSDSYPLTTLLGELTKILNSGYNEDNVVVLKLKELTTLAFKSYNTSSDYLDRAVSGAAKALLKLNAG